MAQFLGKATFASVTPTITAGAYSVGDQLGDLQQFTSLMDCAGTGRLLSVTIVDKASQSSNLDILFFSKQPTVASSDNAQLDISDSELDEKYLGSVTVNSFDYLPLANCSVATIGGLDILLNSVLSRPDNIKAMNIWAVVRCAGTPTFTSTSDLVLKVGVMLD